MPGAAEAGRKSDMLACDYVKKGGYTVKDLRALNALLLEYFIGDALDLIWCDRENCGVGIL